MVNPRKLLTWLLSLLLSQPWMISGQLCPSVSPLNRDLCSRSCVAQAAEGAGWQLRSAVTLTRLSHVWENLGV